MRPLISIIIPVYNVGEYLKECLDSVVNQIFDNFEAIIVNDGSTDDSFAICESYCERYGFFRLINQENKGLSAARNAGTASAKGEYITFLDSDDYLDPDFCSEMYEAARKFDSDVVICEADYFGDFRIDKLRFEEIEEVGTRYSNRILNRSEMLQVFSCGKTHFLIACGKLYRRNVFENNEIIFPEGVLYEDINVVLEIVKASSVFFMLPKPLLNIRIRPGSITSTSFLTKKGIRDCFTQHMEFIENYNAIPRSILDHEYKAKMTERMTTVLSGGYLRYQMPAFLSLILTDAIMDDTVYFLFGASACGKEYVTLLKLKTRNIIFVDNDPAKQGGTFCGFPVISPAALKDMIHAEKRKYKIIITSMYFYSISHQLLETGTVGSHTELFPYNTKTSIEREFLKGFSDLKKYIKYSIAYSPE